MCCNSGLITNRSDLNLRWGILQTGKGNDIQKQQKNHLDIRNMMQIFSVQLSQVLT